ncbi:MAG: hypothetical protein AAFR87_05650 [Bacteroidota bacterium]
MTSSITRKKTFEEFSIKFNAISVQELFRQYEKIGFIYPAKKALLAPHMKEITHNWESLYRSKEEYLWIFTNDPSKLKNFASITAWKQSNYCLQAQHLVSDGNPFLSLKVMLAAQFKAEHIHGMDEIRASQNWFRPNNRYAYRVFASMFEKLGTEKAALNLFQFLQLPLKFIMETGSYPYLVEEVFQGDEEMNRFLSDRFGPAFIQAEELNEEDICLERIGEDFKKYGLHRSRKVLKIKGRSGRLLAAMIMNRAPLGINFSFLENRAYYVLAGNLRLEERLEVLRFMNIQAKSYYRDLRLGAIPIVTGKKSSEALQKLDARWLREYLQSIWLREGFSQWYEHIATFLQRIERRM